MYNLKETINFEFTFLYQNICLTVSLNSDSKLKLNKDFKI